MRWRAELKQHCHDNVRLADCTTLASLYVTMREEREREKERTQNVVKRAVLFWSG